MVVSNTPKATADNTGKDTGGFWRSYTNTLITPRRAVQTVAATAAAIAAASARLHNNSARPPTDASDGRHNGVGVDSSARVMSASAPRETGPVRLGSARRRTSMDSDSFPVFVESETSSDAPGSDTRVSDRRFHGKTERPSTSLKTRLLLWTWMQRRLRLWWTFTLLLAVGVLFLGGVNTPSSGSHLGGRTFWRLLGRGAKLGMFEAAWEEEQALDASRSVVRNLGVRLDSRLLVDSNTVVDLDAHAQYIARLINAEQFGARRVLPPLTPLRCQWIARQDAAPLAVTEGFADAQKLAEAELDGADWVPRDLCCEDSAGGLFCFPSLIGTGAQKSGTTALFARLMMHPDVCVGSKKEAHFFDLEDRWKEGALMYMRIFGPRSDRASASPGSGLPQTDAKPLLNRAVNIDFTPSYMLTQNGCRRIRQLLPHARLVVVLRDPVERVWSEIQMKLRHDGHIVKYLRNVTSSPEFAECLPMLSAFSRQYSRSKRTVTRANRLIEKCVSQSSRREAYFTNFRSSLAYMLTVRREEVEKTGTGRAAVNFESCSAAADAAASSDVAAASNVTLSNEQARIDRVSAAWAQCIMGANPRPMIRRGDDPADMVRELRRQQDELNRCFSGGRCFGTARKPSDISRDNLYRGLYAHQLEQCVKWFPRNQLLLVDGAELRSSPETVLAAVMRHAGLRPVPMESLDEERAWSAFRQKYPRFESLTGWAHSPELEDSSAEADGAVLAGVETAPSPPIPPEVLNLLVEYYRTPNERLFALIGRRFDWK